MISLIKLAIYKDPKKFKQLTRLMNAYNSQQEQQPPKQQEPNKQETSQQEDFFDEQSEPLQKRTTQADDANPQLQTKNQRKSYVSIAFRVLFWGSVGLFSYNMYLNNYKSEPEKEIGYVKFFNDQAKVAQQSYNDFYDFMTKPPIDKLLPDIPQLPPGYEIPKTLVLNLTGTLIKTDFVFGKGQEIIKRPGLQQFLKSLQQMYEIVILSNDDSMFVQSISEKLDPQHMIFVARFGRESLVLDKNRYQKDLKYLNRPLNRVIVIESNPDNLLQYADNGIFIKEFTGDVNDRTLQDLIPLLQYLAKPNIKDVRSEIKTLGNIDPQIKFLELRKIQESQIQNKTVYRAMSQLQQKNPAFQKQQFSDRRF